jgi:uncharacterized protein involved in high-affinity Fe2+ transport
MMKRKIVALAAIAAFAAMSLSACGSKQQATEAAATTEAVASESVEATVEDSAAAAPGEAAGFTEIPIFEDEQIDFINLSAVYFQPVPMTDGSDPADYNMHFEADVAALEGNKLGYGAGDWIPYLTVDYAIINSKGETAAEGTFMPMSASDGPHYGANIKLADADTYSVKLTFHSPAENNYLLHTDAETGPGAASFDEYFPDGKLELELKDVWQYTPQEW